MAMFLALSSDVAQEATPTPQPEEEAADDADELQLATCGLFIYENSAAELEIPLESISVAVEGDLAVQGVRDGSVNPRIQAFRVHIDADGPSAEEAEMLAERFRTRCPIYTTLERSAPIEIVHGAMMDDAAAAEDEAMAEELTPVRVFVPVGDNLQFMNFYVAQGAGYFADEGLDVQIVLPPQPGGGTQWLFMGRADAAILPPPMYLSLIAEEQPLIVFANLLANDPINLVVQGEIAEERGITPDMPLEERL